MKIFIDTAKVEEIRKIAAWGILDGVTTNPSLIAKTGRNWKEVVREILTIVDGPISAEAISLETEAIVKEGRELSKLGKNVNVKIPITPDGLAATKKLSAEGIKVNMTLVFSSNQALLAAKAGAAFISPFIGRIDDMGQDGIAELKKIIEVVKVNKFKSEIIAASIRHPIHVIEAARMGCDIATIPFNILELMVKHPLTDIGIKRFLKDWEGVPK